MEKVGRGEGKDKCLPHREYGLSTGRRMRLKA